ncbi:MAG: hypothetical protein ABL898_16505 [Hyphomicrobiaceae bacterium]|nr:hypothetical protein [Hyphomicrobiaceae bacterium]
MTFKMPVYSDEHASLFIVACDADRIIIYSNAQEDALRLLPLGFNKDEDRTDKIVYVLQLGNDAEKTKLLTALRDLGVPFGYAPAGWPPSAVFELFREHGLVGGLYQQIFRGVGGFIRVTLDN